MSTFLALAQRLRQEAGVAGTGPASVLNQTGMYAKLVDWTARAWVDIQASKPFWKFLRNYVQKTLVVGQQDYNVSADWSLTSVDKWDQEGAFIYKDSISNQNQLTWLPYPKFRAENSHGFGSGRPRTLTDRQGNVVRFDRVPDYAYVVTLDYWMTPELLAANTDTPSMPEHFHDAIVWKALMYYSASEGAPELYQTAARHYNLIYTQLVLDQMETPGKVQVYPLATGRSIAHDTDFWGV